MMVGGGAVKNSTEIYVIEENRWVMGPAFPRGFLQGGYVNLADGSFIIAGGYDVDNRYGGHSLHFFCMLFVKKSGRNLYQGGYIYNVLFRSSQQLHRLGFRPSF